MKVSCKAKLRKDIKDRGKPSIEFYFKEKPRYFCYGYIDQRTDELIDECKECPEHVYKADEVMQKLKNGEIACSNLNYEEQQAKVNELLEKFIQESLQEEA